MSHIQKIWQKVWTYIFWDSELKMTILWRHTGCQRPWPLIFCRKSHKNQLFFIRFSKKVWKQQFWIFGMILFIWHILEKACVKLQKKIVRIILTIVFLPYFQKTWVHAYKMHISTYLEISRWNRYFTTSYSRFNIQK